MCRFLEVSSFHFCCFCLAFTLSIAPLDSCYFYHLPNSLLSSLFHYLSLHFSSLPLLSFSLSLSLYLSSSLSISIFVLLPFYIPVAIHEPFRFSFLSRSISIQLLFLSSFASNSFDVNHSISIHKWGPWINHFFLNHPFVLRAFILYENMISLLFAPSRNENKKMTVLVCHVAPMTRKHWFCNPSLWP